MDTNATLDLARVLISPESNLKQIDAFDDAAHAIACGYINQHAELAKKEEQLRVAVEALNRVVSFHVEKINPLSDAAILSSHAALQQIAALDAPIKEGME